MFRSVLRSVFVAILIGSLSTIGLASSIVTNSGGAAAATTPCSPQISSISAFDASQTQNVTITGSCFGGPTAFTNDVSFFAITDNNYPIGNPGVSWWQACSNTASPLGPNLVTCTVSSWTDTSITFTGFNGTNSAYGGGRTERAPNGWTVQQGDPLVVSVWNANSGTGPASCLVTQGTAANSCTPPVNISIAPGSPNVAGVETVPVANVPSGNVRNATGSTAGDAASAPLSSIPLSSIPLSSIPLSSIPLSSIPLSSIALPPTGSPTGIVAAQQALSRTLLSDVSIIYPGGCSPATTPCTGWQGILTGTSLANVPLESVTLQQVLADPTAGPRLDSVSLGTLDLSASPLSSIPLSSIELGSAPLSSIGLDGTSPGTGALSQWCTQLSTLGSSCSAFGINAASGSTTVSLLTLALAGIPLSSIPLSSIPLSSIPLSSIPLSSIPLSSINLSTSPLSSIPLSSIPLSSIPLSSIPLSSIPLSSIGSIVNCNLVNCTTGTLGDAYNANAFFQTATLGMLPASYNGTTLAQLLINDNTGFPGYPSLTLGDLVLATIPPATFHWQNVDMSTLPLANLENPGGLGGTVTYTVALGVGIAGSNEPVSVALPPTFAYVPGSSALDGQAIPDPTDTTIAQTDPLDWPIGQLSVGNHTLTFKANAGTGLGPAIASAGVQADGRAVSENTSGAVNVIDGEQPGINSAATGFSLGAGNLNPTSPINQGDLNIGYLTSPGNVNDWTISVPQGAELSLALTNLPATYDLALFGPSSPQLQGAPAQNLPGVTDNLPGVNPGTTTEPTPGSQDIPVTPPPGDQLMALSNNPNGQSQYIQTTPLAAGTYVVQVSGYNGAYSSQPYLLQGNILGGGTAPSCSSGISYLGGLGSAYSGPISVPNKVNTLFLVNTQRLTAAFGSAAESTVMTDVNQVASDSAAGVVGAVIPVDAYAGVQNAYTAWNSNPCSVPLANGVTAAISSVVDQIRANNPTVQNLVIVGADDQIPMARISDGAAQSNERDYGASTFAGENNPEADALSLGYFLSDDPYVSATPLGVGSATLYLPQLGEGRLVESATQIEGSLTRFFNSFGNLNATTGLTTGYSFLTSGANAVSANLSANGINASSLINENWTTSQLDTALAANPAPAIDSINAHFDFSRALPAYDNTNNVQSNLFTTSDVRNPSPATSYAGRVLFSMGCHSGLEISDAEVSTSGLTTPVDDWAKTFADTGALWVANTGYGYADTDTIAYSAKLMSKFASNLNGSLTIGEALATAKQQYAAGNAILSPYDLKALMESTFYGLPMYHLNSASAPVQPPNGPPTQNDPVTGLTEAPVSLSLATGSAAGQLSLVPTTNGSYYQVNGTTPTNPGTQTTEFRPIEPLATLPVSEPGLVAHGALLNGLHSSDTGNFTPAYSLPAVGAANSAPPLIGGAAFPGTLQRVASFSTFTANGTSQASQLDLVAGQFFPNPNNSGSGTQRVFNQFGGDVFYLPSNSPLANDFTPPTINSSQAIISGGGVNFTVQTSPAGSGAPVKEVVVLYADGTNPGTWTPITLSSADGSNWTGGENVNPNIQYLVEAVDAAGNVAVSNNEGADFNGMSQPTLGIQLSGASVVNGFYTGPVTVTITAPSGSTYVLDNGTPTAVPPTSFPVSGDGVHTVTVTSPDGSQSQTQSFSISSTQTNTSLNSSANPSPVGQPVTFTATVSPATTGAATPTGNVEFLDGGTAVASCGGTSGVQLNAGTATCQITYGTPGTRQITAQYLGGAFAASSSLPLSEVIGLLPATTAAVSSSANPILVGKAVTYTAKVSPAVAGSPTPTGSVEFLDGTTPISGCTSKTLSGAGTATCSQTYSTPGLHNITAQYLGSATYQPSTSTVFSEIATSGSCNNLSGCKYLTGLNLAGANLPGANLSSSNLSGTNLTGANLTGANLSSSNLTSANLTGANLTGANLSSAILKSATMPNAMLKSANLSGANASSANMSGDNLTTANAANAIFRYANLSNAIFTGANTTGADFTSANLSGAKF